MWIGNLIAVIVLSLPPPMTAADPVGGSEFRTMPGSEDTQGYHLDFTSDDRRTRLYVSLIVSNFGPGEQSNGASVILARAGEEPRIWTAGYSHRSLIAQPGRFGLKIGRCKLSLDALGRVHVKLWLPDPDITIRLRLEPQVNPVRLTDGPVRVSRTDNAYFEATLPVPFGRAAGTIHIAGETEHSIAGTAGLAYLFADHPMYPYARRLHVLRAREPDGGRGVYLAVFEGSDEARLALFGAAVWTEKGGVVRRGRVRGMRATYERDERGLPLRVEYDLAVDGTSCVLALERSSAVARFLILEHVPWLVGLLLRWTGAEPSVLHAAGRLGGCSEAASGFMDASWTYYVIRDG